MRKIIVAALMMGMSMLTACSAHYNDAGSNADVSVNADAGADASEVTDASAGADASGDLKVSAGSDAAEVIDANAGADAADDLKVSDGADVPGETQGDESSSRVYLDESEVKDLKEKFFDTNVTNIFKNHDSLEFQVFRNGIESEFCWENSEGMYCIQSYLERAIYLKKDRINYTMMFDKETGKCDFGVDFHLYPEYRNSYHVVKPDKSLAFNDVHETFHAYKEGEFIYLIDEEDDELSRETIEELKLYGSSVDYHGQKVFVEFIIDADNYDCIERTAKYIQDGKEEVLERTKISYDTPEPMESVTLRSIFERESKNMMDITIVVNPGAKDEKTYTTTIPQNLDVFITPDVPYVMFDDPDFTTITSWDRMSDMTRYVVLNPDEELIERYNELLEKLMNGEG